MSHHQLPCDGDGICMICKITPPDVETLTCKTCVTPWHVKCLSSPPQTLSSTLQWDCPDCSPILTTEEDLNPPVISHINPTGNLISAIRQIQSDQSLTDQEKAKKRQDLLSGVSAQSPSHDDDDDNDDDDKSQKNNKKKKKKNKEDEGSDVLAVLGSSLNCSFCMQVPERPVTTPCGHNFCLKCFEKWVGQGKRTCAKCRSTIPPKMASQPRINSALVVAIRMARASKANNGVGPLKVQHFIRNENRPDKAFTTDRAKKTGKANACSGKIFVTVPPDHFGPILAENDPDRRQGVLVGECWEDRMECRQWGAHFPHVAGIAGQSEYGAQSVALSGGYQDDEDHGEWFLYTGSGGRDLSGNKRTNKDQSFDQKFEKSNEALRVSCKKGYPVRVVRSHKEKRSAYAPESGVRYDGVYRIEKCWRKVGIQGFKVCRYLFVRCDNEPAPWTSDEHGDRPRALPVIKELKGATDITERTETPSWDYHEEEACWKWKKPPPLSRKPMDSENPEERKKARKAIKEAQYLTVREKLLKEFNCLICRKVMNLPLTTPCAHNFCKPCLEGAFTGKTFVKERTCEGRRTLRAQKVVMKCPCCPTDISDFLQNPQVNRELMDVIESLQTNLEEDTEENVELGEEDSDSEEKTEVVTEDTKKAEVVTEDTKKAKVVVDSKEVEVVITETRKDEVLMEEIKEAEVVMEETKEAEAVTVETKVVMEETKEAEVLMEETKEAEAVTEETKEAKVVIEVIKEAEVVPEITEDSEIASGEDLQENPIESKSKQNKKRKKGNPSGKKPNASDKEDGMEISGSPKTETPSKRRKANDTSHVSGSGGVRTRSMRSKELLEENHASGGVRTRRMRSG